jgi:hypothetical protein
MKPDIIEDQKEAFFSKKQKNDKNRIMLYEYKQENFSYEQRLIRDLSDIKHYEIKFPSYFKTGSLKNDTVILNCFLPKGFWCLLIILPGLGSGFLQKILIEYFARRLAKNNIGVCILTLPYHYERRPHNLRRGEYFLSLDAQQTLDFFQQAVVDVERTVYFWQDHFNIEDFSLMGISLGSMVGIISMAKIKSIKKGILILSGGNFFQILWRGFLRFFAKKDCSFEECKLNFHNLTTYRELKEFTDLQNIKFPKVCMYYEPTVFACLLRDREILMFNSLFDPLIPFKSAKELWKALNFPKIYWFPTDHHFIFIFSFFILSKVKNFLKPKT